MRGVFDSGCQSFFQNQKIFIFECGKSGYLNYKTQIKSEIKGLSIRVQLIQNLFSYYSEKFWYVLIMYAYSVGVYADNLINVGCICESDMWSIIEIV